MNESETECESECENEGIKVCANADVNVKVNAKHKIRAPEHTAHTNTIKYFCAHCAQYVSVRRGA